MSGRRAGLRRIALLAAACCLPPPGAFAATLWSREPVGQEEPITPTPPPPGASALRVRLGEQLFRDPRLSGRQDRTCASCHDLSTNGASGRARDVMPGGGGKVLNTPTVFNAALSFRLNWAGTFRTLEDQARASLLRPETMNADPAAVVARLGADPATVAAFRRAYGRTPDQAALLDALATFERSLLTPNSRFDRWLRGDARALSERERRGYVLFKSIGCASCHQGRNVGANLFARHGIFHPLASPDPAIVRVPSLRNVAVTAPYFHDGSAPTLEEAIGAMARSQLDQSLTEAQIADIAAFLGSLTGEYRGRRLTTPPP